MTDIVISIMLLACTVIALVISRRREPLTQVATGAALLLVIGVFLGWKGTSPLPHFGDVPVGLLGAWYRGLAIVWWLIGARLVVTITVLVRGRDPRSREARLFQELTAAIIYITAVLIILNSVLGLNITSVLATSGVVAIVLGLALQNTLADVFAGIAVGIEQPFQVGDRVSLGNDIEGTIVQMNWRSIRVETDDEDLATIPNSVVAKGQIVNRSVPSRRRASAVEASAPADTSPAVMFELLRQATLLCPTILTTPPPSITMRRVGLRTSTYAIRFSVSDTPHLVGTRSQLLRQVSRVLIHAGIGRPYRIGPGELLKSLVIFEALSQSELDTLTEHLITHDVEPGDVIFEQGAVSLSIFVVAAGIMEMVRDLPGGGGKTNGRIGPGEYVGEVGLITGHPRARTMTALTHGRVQEVPGACILALLKTNTSLGIAMELSVRRGLASLDRDGAALEARPAEQGGDLLARIRMFFGLSAA